MPALSIEPIADLDEYHTVSRNQDLQTVDQNIEQFVVASGEKNLLKRPGDTLPSTSTLLLDSQDSHPSNKAAPVLSKKANRLRQ